MDTLGSITFLFGIYSLLIGSYLIRQGLQQRANRKFIQKQETRRDNQLKRNSEIFKKYGDK